MLTHCFLNVGVSQKILNQITLYNLTEINLKERKKNYIGGDRGNV